ncbi:MAG TPA: response regulator transcription factor [Alphaproteobacteria bacterium]|nr:response regulator transcription factor [Alphaproteobacteria bacterium]
MTMNADDGLERSAPATPEAETGNGARPERASGEPLGKLRVIVVDDEDMLRWALVRNLADQNFEVADFGHGQAALDHLQQGSRYDVLLLDWKMPDMAGIDVLRALRRLGIKLPVVVLTAYSSEDNEVEALDCGAIDFLDKSRSPSILARRLRIIAATERKLAAALGVEEVLCVSDLELHPKIRRAFWRGARVPLTVTEFDIVHILASRAGREVSYREIYDVVHGTDFIAGDGSAGYRINVRSLIKRIRQKFHAMDSGFAAIENYAGFGYSWRAAEDASTAATALETSDDARAAAPFASREKSGRFWGSLARFAGLGRPDEAPNGEGRTRRRDRGDGRGDGRGNGQGGFRAASVEADIARLAAPGSRADEAERDAPDEEDAPPVGHRPYSSDPL